MDYEKLQDEKSLRQEARRRTDGKIRFMEERFKFQADDEVMEALNKVNYIALQIETEAHERGMEEARFNYIRHMIRLGCSNKQIKKFYPEEIEKNYIDVVRKMLEIAGNEEVKFDDLVELLKAIVDEE